MAGKSISDMLMSETIIPRQPGHQYGVRSRIPQSDASSAQLMAEMLDRQAMPTPSGVPSVSTDQSAPLWTRFLPPPTTPGESLSLAANIFGGPGLRGVGVRSVLTPRPAANARPEVGPPLSLMDRNWQNYGQHMKPDDVVSSEAVWGGARRLSEETGVPVQNAFAQLANDMWQRMGANRYITPDSARREMGKQRGIGAVEGGETKGIRAAASPMAQALMGQQEQ